MDPILLSIIVAFFLSAITIIADMLIKNASLQNSFSGWNLLAVGCLIYGLTGLGWFYVMRL